MPRSAETDIQAALKAAQAAAPLYWEFLQEHRIPELVAQEAADHPFLEETPDRLTFQRRFQSQLTLTRDPDRPEWQANQPYMPLSPAKLRGHLLSVWNTYHSRISTSIYNRQLTIQRERELRPFAYNHPLTAALTDHIAGPRPDLPSLAARIIDLLNPDGDTAGQDFAGADSPLILHRYCQQYRPQLADLQRRLGPIILQFCLKQLDWAERQLPPPPADTAWAAARRKFLELQKRKPQPRPEHYDYFRSLPAELLEHPIPPHPAAATELCELLAGASPHPRLFNAFAQHHRHPLRWSRLSDQYQPAAMAWLQWLNRQLKTDPEPDPQLLTTLQLAAVTRKETGAAVRKVLGTAPTAAGAAVHQSIIRELNAAGHRLPTPAHRSLRQQQQDRQAQQRQEAFNRLPLLAARLPEAIAELCVITADAQGILHYTGPGSKQLKPWLRKAGQTPGQRAAEQEAHQDRYDLGTPFNLAVVDILQQSSPLWRELSPEEAELAWNQLRLYDGQIRHWLDIQVLLLGPVLTGLLNRAARLAEPGLTAQLSGLLPPGLPLTLELYNNARTGGAPWQSVLQTNPGAAAWWLRSSNPRPPVNHPGQIVKQCRAEFARAGGQRWAALARSPAAVILDLLCSQDSGRRLWLSRRQLAWLANALPQDPSHQLLPPRYTVANLLPSRPDLDQANTRQLAQLFLREYARRQGEWPHARNHLENTIDWMRAMPADQPLPARTWQRAARHSERWHRDTADASLQVKRAALLARQQGRIRVWPNALDQWTDPTGQYCFTPLADEYDLLAESADLHHCVGSGSYGRQCHDGRSRIYHITAPQGEFTVEITRESGGRWSVRQLRGRRNKPAPPPVHQAAAGFAAAYALAHVRILAHRRAGWWTEPPPEPGPFPSAEGPVD